MENIIEKLRKIKKLADKGINGESENAKLLLKQLMQKYGINDFQIEENEPKKDYKFHVKNQLEERLFFNCMANLFGSESEIMNSGYNYKHRKKDLYFNMTLSEYVLAREFFDFHVKYFNKTMEKEKMKILRAYIHANDIFDITPQNQETGETGKTEESITEIMEILAMSERIKNEIPTFRKSLNQ